MSPFSLWVYLSATPLVWLTVTLVAWLAADASARASNHHPLVNPVLIAVGIVAALLQITGTAYRTYFDGAQFVHFLLGPATVALGVPLARSWSLVRRYLLPMLAALAAGAVTGIVSAVGIALAVDLPRELVVSLAPKSVTTGVAMAIAEGMHGEPALTAVLVLFAGIIGAVMATPLMNALGIRNYAARGFSVGLASHGIGTARAFTVDPVAGTFAGIAMALNAIVTALIAPVVLRWV